MQNPSVSFVVPCYKLAHLLPECINSILSQTFRDFEVLIMDDCSPDNTAEVAQSFQDPRVKHIRNDPNLGHLRNYNKGIDLARGRYIWLISADDCLRKPYILERYVEQMDANPLVGFAYCPAMGLKNGRETELLTYSVYSDGNLIIKGHEFLKKLLKSNIVPAPSGLVRRECYNQLGAFPLNMPHAGDWYLWCLFSLHFDVAYFAEPMVCYREHDLNMSSALMKKSAVSLCWEDLNLVWAIKQKADAAGFSNVSRDCLRALGYIYSQSILFGRYYNREAMITWEQFEESLQHNSATEDENAFICTQTCIEMAEAYFARDNVLSAMQYYQASLNYNRWNALVYMKIFLLALGKPGKILRNALRSVRDKKLFNRLLSSGRRSL